MGITIHNKNACCKQDCFHHPKIGWACSSHRSISFRESMPLLRESVTHWPINWQSALIPSPSQELFFWSLFCRTDNVRESLELAEGTYLSHMTALIPLETLRSLLALNTLPTNPGPAYRPATQRDTFSLSLLHACYWNKPYFVVLLKEVLLFICVA